MASRGSCALPRGVAAPGKACRQTIEPEIDHRRREQREDLAEQEAANDGDAERMPELRSSPGAQHQWQSAEHGGHGGHQDWPEAQEAGLENGFARALASGRWAS